MSRPIRIAAILWFVALGPSPMAQAALVIDTFDTPAFPEIFSVPTATPPAAIHSGAGILGTRALTSSSALASGDLVGIGDFGPVGIFQVATGFTALETGLSYTFFGTQDLSGDLGIQYDFFDLFGGTSPTTEFDVTLITASGSLSGSITLSNSATPFSATLPFTSFTGSGSLSAVTGFVFSFNDGGSPNIGADFDLNTLSVAAIPEGRPLLIWGALSTVSAGICYVRRHVPTVRRS